MSPRVRWLAHDGLVGTVKMGWCIATAVVVGDWCVGRARGVLVHWGGIYYLVGAGSGFYWTGWLVSYQYHVPIANLHIRSHYCG